MTNTHLLLPDDLQSQGRRTIEAALNRLYALPPTRVILDALDSLSRREKGIFLFTHGQPVVSREHVEDLVGYYNGNHTLYIDEPVLEHAGWEPTAWINTFIHEAQHMLFGRLVDQASSPVKADSREERDLDAVMARDRQVRAALDLSALSPAAHALYDDIVRGLEQNKGYFIRGAFNLDNAYHRHILRAESVVRLAAARAVGATEADVNAVAPNLAAFYQASLQPMLVASVGVSSAFIESPGRPGTRVKFSRDPRVPPPACAASLKSCCIGRTPRVPAPCRPPRHAGPRKAAPLPGSPDT
jgi:hypothetical protein